MCVCVSGERVCFWCRYCESLVYLHLSCLLLRRQMQIMITQISITASSKAATAAIRMYGVRMSPLSHQATYPTRIETSVRFKTIKGKLIKLLVLTCHLNFTRLPHSDAVGGHADVRSHRRDIVVQHQNALVGIATRLMVLQRIVLVLETPLEFRFLGASDRGANEDVLVVNLLAGYGARGLIWKQQSTMTVQ